MNTPVRLKYDVPTEVSETAFNIISKEYADYCPLKKTPDGKYLIKIWQMSGREEIEKIINDNPLIPKTPGA